MSTPPEGGSPRIDDVEKARSIAEASERQRNYLRSEEARKEKIRKEGARSAFGYRTKPGMEVVRTQYPAASGEGVTIWGIEEREVPVPDRDLEQERIIIEGVEHQAALRFDGIKAARDEQQRRRDANEKFPDQWYDAAESARQELHTARVELDALKEQLETTSDETARLALQKQVVSAEDRVYMLKTKDEYLDRYLNDYKWFTSRYPDRKEELKRFEAERAMRKTGNSKS